MTTTLLGIVAAAALFALFGLLHHDKGCGGSCGSCAAGSCIRKESSHENL